MPQYGVAAATVELAAPPVGLTSVPSAMLATAAAPSMTMDMGRSFIGSSCAEPWVRLDRRTVA